jgi:hypothetical protein
LALEFKLLQGLMLWELQPFPLLCWSTSQRKRRLGTMDGGPLQREANAANKKTVDESYHRNFCRSTCALIVVSVLVTFLLEMVLPVCCTPAPRHEPI